MSNTTGVPMTREMMHFLLEQLSFKTVVEWDAYRVQKRQFGWSDDDEGHAGVCQAALSAGLQVLSPPGGAK